MNILRTHVNIHLKVYINYKISFKGYKKHLNLYSYGLMVFINKNLPKNEVKLYKHSKKTTKSKFLYEL